MRTTKLRSQYITGLATFHARVVARAIASGLTWRQARRELLMLLAAVLVAAAVVVERSDQFGAEWLESGARTSIVAVRLSGVVWRTTAPDVHFFIGERNGEEIWKRASQATPDEIATKREEFRELYAAIGDPSQVVVNWDGSIDAHAPWAQVFSIWRSELSVLTSMTLIIFMLSSGGMGIRSDIVDHCKFACLTAHALHEGLQTELADLKIEGAPSWELRRVRMRSIIGPPVVFLLGLTGLTALANNLRF